MDKFSRLVSAIQRYENDSCGMKATAHHSAVSVRVAEMEAAMGSIPKTSVKAQSKTGGVSDIKEETNSGGKS